MGNSLNRCCSSTNEANLLVAQFVKVSVKSATRIFVVPTTCMETMPLELFNSLNSWEFGHIQWARRRRSKACPDLVTSIRLDDPPGCLLIPSELVCFSVEVCFRIEI